MIGQISASNQLPTSCELAPNMFGVSSELAPNMFAAGSELASVMEFGFLLLTLQTSWESSGTSSVSSLPNSTPRSPSWPASRRRHHGDGDDDDDDDVIDDDAAYDADVLATKISMRASGADRCRNRTHIVKADTTGRRNRPSRRPSFRATWAVDYDSRRMTARRDDQLRRPACLG